MKIKNILFTISLLILIFSTSGFAQENLTNWHVCFGGSNNLSGGGKTATLTVGQPSGATMSGSHGITLGMWSFYQLPPMSSIVSASDGDHSDRVEVSWIMDPLSPPSDMGSKLFRDGSFLLDVEGNINLYNDTNVEAGNYYNYGVRGINEYGMGSLGEDVGFVNPNGVITGHIQTLNLNSVPDAVVSITPDLGRSLYLTNDNYITVPDAASLRVTSALTVEAWIKPLSTANDPGVIAKNDAAGFLIYIDSSDNKLKAYIGSTQLVGNTITLGEWTHVAITYDGSEKNLYMDGIPVATVSSNINANTGTSDLYIGKWADVSGRSWDGRIDDIRIWNIACTKDEINRNKGRTLTGDETGLAAYWKTDEGTSYLTFDLTDYDNDGEILNPANVWSTDKAPVLTSAFTNSAGNYIMSGIYYGSGTTFTVTPSKEVTIGRALDFDGVDDYVQVDDNFPMPADFTLEAWIKTSSSATKNIIAWGMESDAPYCALRIDGGKLAYTQLGTVPQTITSSASVNSDSWTHVAVTKSGTNVQLYVDANPDGNGTAEAFPDTLDVCVLGTSYVNGSINPNRHFYGIIDEIRVWDTARTENQIAGTKNQVLEGDETGLTAYWKLNEGASDVADDNSQNNYHATIINPNASDIWTDDIPLDEIVVHEFVPESRIVTLNESSTSADGIDYTDVSLVPVSGYVKYAGTSCYVDSVEILIDGDRHNPPIYTNEDGYFIVEFDPGTNHQISCSYSNHDITLPSGGEFYEVYNVSEPISGILFVDNTKRDLDVSVVGGQCKFPIIPDVGTITVTLESTPSCYEVTQDLISGTVASFNDLPPLKYVVTVDHPNPDVDFDGRQVSLVDTSRIGENAPEFMYRAPIQVEIDGLPQPPCDEFTDVDGSPLPALPVLEQYNQQTIDITIFEDYTNFDGGDLCPVDTGTVTIETDIADTQDVVYPFSNGELNNITLKVGPPNILQGANAYQKYLQATAEDSLGRMGTVSKNVYVKGNKTNEATYTTVTPEIPLWILRDPPGDGSYSYLTEEMSVSTGVSYSYIIDEELGVEKQLKAGAEFSTGIGFIVESVTSITMDFGLTVTTTEAGQEQNEFTLTTSESFATSDDGIIPGDQGDVFIGGAMNLVYALTTILDFDDNCQASLDTTLMVAPDGFETFYVYSQYHIVNDILPALEMLGDYYHQCEPDSACADSAIFFENQIDVWNEVLTMNQDLKDAAVFDQNISFDAASGAYESVKTQVRSSSSNFEFGVKMEESVALKLGGESMGWGGYVKGTIKLSQGFTYEHTEHTDSTCTVGYILDDDDVGDFFSVDVKEDPVYGTPVFDLIAGESSCPWEEETLAREGVNLTIDHSTEVNVPPTEEAIFTLLLGNTSQSGETRSYSLELWHDTNPNGAEIYVNGVNMATPRSFYIQAGYQLPVTLSVQKGPVAYDYEDIYVHLYSDCEADIAAQLGTFVPTIGSTASFSVYFTEPCTEIFIDEPTNNWLITPADEDTMWITLTGYDPAILNLQGLKIQYRPQSIVGRGDGSFGDEFDEAFWQYDLSRSVASQSKTPQLNPYGERGGERDNPWVSIIIYPEFGDGLIPADSLSGAGYDIIPWDVGDLDDGKYDLRAISVCSGDSPDGASGIVSGLIDRQPPQVLGSPQPSDGVLEPGDDISVSFDEAINCSEIHPYDNVKLIKVSTGQPVDKSVSCYENQLIITPTVPQSSIENHILRATVLGIEDIYGTAIEDSIMWEFRVDLDPVRWSDAYINEVKYTDENITIYRSLINNGINPMTFNLTSVPSWINISPLSGTIPVGSSQTITIQFSDQLGGGEYEDVLYAETVLGDEPLEVDLRVLCYPPNWSLNPGEFEHSMTVTAVLSIEDVLSTDTYDIVAAFVDNEVRGLTNLQYMSALEGVVHPYEVFLTIYSNVTDGETVNFQVWDASECRQLAQILETYPFEANAVHGMPTDPDTITATTQVVQNTNFSHGWNWFSTSLEANDMSINSVLNSLSPQAEDIIKGQTAYSQYVDGAGWIGSLNTIDHKSMYMIKLAGADTLERCGYPPDVELVPVTVDSGWNWISYLPQMSMDINYALSSLTPFSGDLIKTQTDYAQFIENMGWLGSLIYMNPKKGYLLFTDNPNPTDLVYPEAPLARDYVMPPQITETELPDGWEVTPGDYQYNMTVTGIVLRNGEVITDSLEAMGAFCGDECRGVAYPAYVPQLEQSFMFLMMYSNEAAGEIMEFKVYEETGDTTYLINEGVEFSADEILGSVEEPFIWSYDIEMTGLTDNFIAIPERYELGQNYPNPFNPTTTINYGLPENAFVEIAIYNMAGQKVRTLISEKQEAGYKKIIWDSKDDSGKEVASGVYIYRMEAGDFKETKRLVLLK